MTTEQKNAERAALLAPKTEEERLGIKPSFRPYGGCFIGRVGLGTAYEVWAPTGGRYPAMFRTPIQAADYVDSGFTLDWVSLWHGLPTKKGGAL